MNLIKCGSWIVCYPKPLFNVGKRQKQKGPNLLGERTTLFKQFCGWLVSEHQMGPADLGSSAESALRGSDSRTQTCVKPQGWQIKTFPVFFPGFLENPFSSETSYLVTLAPLIKQEDPAQPLFKAVSSLCTPAQQSRVNKKHFMCFSSRTPCLYPRH